MTKYQASQHIELFTYPIISCYNKGVRKNYGNKRSSIIDDLDSGAAPDASTDVINDLDYNGGGELASTSIERVGFYSV